MKTAQPINHENPPITKYPNPGTSIRCLASNSMHATAIVSQITPVQSVKTGNDHHRTGILRGATSATHTKATIWIKSRPKLSTLANTSIRQFYAFTSTMSVNDD
jgi:hypothetical protein